MGEGDKALDTADLWLHTRTNPQPDLEGNKSGTIKTHTARPHLRGRPEWRSALVSLDRRGHSLAGGMLRGQMRVTRSQRGWETSSLGYEESTDVCTV